MRTRVTPASPLRLTRIEQRRRRFFGLAGSQVPQELPIRGTPPDEPQPNMVMVPVIAYCAQPGFGTLPNSAKKLSVVIRAISAVAMPFTSASLSSVFTT